MFSRSKLEMCLLWEERTERWLSLHVRIKLAFIVQWVRNSELWAEPSTIHSQDIHGIVSSATAGQAQTHQPIFGHLLNTSNSMLLGWANISAVNVSFAIRVILHSFMRRNYEVCLQSRKFCLYVKLLSSRMVNYLFLYIFCQDSWTIKIINLLSLNHIISFQTQSNNKNKTDNISAGWIK